MFYRKWTFVKFIFVSMLIPYFILFYTLCWNKSFKTSNACLPEWIQGNFKRYLGGIIEHMDGRKKTFSVDGLCRWRISDGSSSSWGHRLSLSPNSLTYSSKYSTPGSALLCDCFVSKQVWMSALIFSLWMEQTQWYNCCFPSLQSVACRRKPRAPDINYSAKWR